MPFASSLTGSAAVRTVRPARRIRRDEAAQGPARPAGDRRGGFGGGDRQRVGTRRPERRDLRRQTAARRLVEHARGREAGNRRILPVDDRVSRRHTEHAQCDILDRPFTSSATIARSADASASGADAKQRALPKPNSSTPRSTSSRCAAPAQTTTLPLPIRAICRSSSAPSSPCHSPAPARSATTIRPRAAHRADVGRSADPRRERLDRRGLHQIERLARGDRSGRVDRAESSCARSRARERVRERAAEFAGAENGDVRHPWAIVMAAMKKELRGQVALVTGGSRGIGFAIARALAAEGLHVAITGRNEKDLSDARRRIEGAGPGRRRGAPLPTFGTTTRSSKRSPRRSRRFDGLDVVVNNAGAGLFADIETMRPEQWAEVIDTNLTGVYNTCHFALPHLQESRRRLHHQHQQPGRDERRRRTARRTAHQRPASTRSAKC